MDERKNKAKSYAYSEYQADQVSSNQEECQLDSEVKYPKQIYSEGMNVSKIWPLGDFNHLPYLFSFWWIGFRTCHPRIATKMW